MNESWNKIYRLFSFKCVYFYIKCISTFSCNFSIKIHKFKMQEFRRATENFRALETIHSINVFFFSSTLRSPLLNLSNTIQLSNCRSYTWTHTNTEQKKKQSRECSTISDGLIFWWRVKKSWHIFLVAMIELKLL